MTATAPIEMLTVQDICKILKVSHMTIYRLIERKELPAFRIGQNLRIDPRDFADYMRGSNTMRGEG